MFGRVRASTVSSLELLEMERPPPKITKQDSLSIYEATLLRLKQGSCRSPTENSPKTNEQLAMAIDMPESTKLQADADSLSTNSGPDSSISFQSTCFVKEGESKNMSILCFFSRCKSSTNAQSSADEEPMSGYNSSSNVSTSSANRL